MILSRRAVVAGGLAAFAAPALRGSNSSDGAIIRRAYGLLHPGLLRYNSPSQIETRFDQFQRDWDAADDLAGRYLTLTKLLASFKCGHSYANFYNQKPSVATALFSGRNRLPFRFRWLGSQMIVTDGALPRGSAILSIDGRPVADILSALMPLTRADGSNDGKRMQLLSVMGTDDYETFDILYPLLFPVGDSFDIRCRTPDGEELQTRLPAIDLIARQSARPQAASPQPDAPQWMVEHDGRTATLTMNGWAVYNSHWDWKAWLDAAFEDMDRRATDRLIIDIRRNEGGLDCGHEIIARLIDTPLAINAYARRVRYRRIPDDLAPYCDTWDPSFKDWGSDATPYDDRFYDLKGDGNGLSFIQPKGPRFKGRVLVLTSAENSSATLQFAQLMQQNRLSTLIGEQTGGNQRGINGGAFFFLRLPQSGLEADLPLIGYFPNSAKPDAGIMPDIRILTSAKDITLGRDAAMEAALKIRA